MSATRLATYTTHRHPDDRDRFVAKKRIPFHGSVASVVRGAAEIVPSWQPNRVMFHAGKKSGYSLAVSFGVDDNGREHSVNVELLPEDVTPLLFDFARLGSATNGMFIAIMNLGVDGGRKQKSKPKMSKQALKQAEAPAMVL